MGHETPTTSAGAECAFVEVAVELQGFALRFADSHEKIAELNALVDRGMAEVVDLVRRAEVAEEAYGLIERAWRERKSEGPSGDTQPERPSSLDERQPAENLFTTVGASAPELLELNRQAAVSDQLPHESAVQPVCGRNGVLDVRDGQGRRNLEGESDRATDERAHGALQEASLDPSSEPILDVDQGTPQKQKLKPTPGLEPGTYGLRTGGSVDVEMVGFLLPSGGSVQVPAVVADMYRDTCAALERWKAEAERIARLVDARRGAR